jgi:hypothetical protein
MPRQVYHPGLQKNVVIGGCKLSRHEHVGLRLKDFLHPSFPSSPSTVDYSGPALSVIENIEGNAEDGDCCEAEDSHYIGVITGNAGNLFSYTAAQTLADYSAITGFNPADPSTDQGTDPIANLNYRVQKGYADGSKDAGWVLVDATNMAEVMFAINEFGNLKMWFGIPDSIVQNLPSQSGFVWDVSAGNADPNNGHCFTGDTKVSLLDGRELSLAELADGAAGDSFWVYSCDNGGNVVAGHAHSARMTRAAAELVEVELDNGERIKCTADHRFLMRDGIYKEAASLQPGESLMPLYRRTTAHGYEEYSNPRTGGWHLTHRMVAHGATPKSHSKHVLHHIDFNKKNNDPRNLLPLSREAHTALHQETADVIGEYARSPRGRKKSAELMSRLWADGAWRTKMQSTIQARTSAGGHASWRKFVSDPELLAKKQNVARANLQLASAAPWTPERQRRHTTATREGILAWRADLSEEERKRFDQVAIRNLQATKDRPLTEKQREARRRNAAVARAHKRAPFNHKVVAVRPAGVEDVYDLTVDVHHNFALSAGVFVHNCIGSCGYNPARILNVGMTSKGVLVMTWGMLGLITWPFLATCFVSGVGGGLAVRVNMDWVSKTTAVTPSGLNAAALITAFNANFGQNLPVPAPAPTPSPTPAGKATLAQAEGWGAAGINGSHFPFMTKAQAIAAMNVGMAAKWPTS